MVVVPHSLKRCPAGASGSYTQAVYAGSDLGVEALPACVVGRIGVADVTGWQGQGCQEVQFMQG
jgi:hypothetical protein